MAKNFCKFGLIGSLGPELARMTAALSVGAKSKGIIGFYSTLLRKDQRVGLRAIGNNKYTCENIREELGGLCPHLVDLRFETISES